MPIFTIAFGTIGTVGEMQTKEFKDQALVKQEHDLLIAEKLARGYRETTAVAPAHHGDERSARLGAFFDALRLAQS